MVPHAEVVIVGVGPSGAVVASELVAAGLDSPDGAPCPLPPLPMGEAGRRAAAGMNRFRRLNW